MWSNYSYLRLPWQDNVEALDHHHNMVARLNKLPPSLRGNQVKKNVAFLHLQQIFNNG